MLIINDFNAWIAVLFSIPGLVLLEQCLYDSIPRYHFARDPQFKFMLGSELLFMFVMGIILIGNLTIGGYVLIYGG